MQKMRTKIIGSVKKGYRRGGVSHDREWKEFDLTDDQMQAIMDDSRLVIEKIPKAAKPEPIKKPVADNLPPRRRKKQQQEIPE